MENKHPTKPLGKTRVGERKKKSWIPFVLRLSREEIMQTDFPPKLQRTEIENSLKDNGVHVFIHESETGFEKVLDEIQWIFPTNGFFTVWISFVPNGVACKHMDLEENFLSIQTYLKNSYASI